MADVLVNDAFRDVHRLMDIENGLVIDSAIIKNAVNSTIASIDYTNVQPTFGIELTRLSCNEELVSCHNNGKTAWDDLEDFNKDTLYNKLSWHDGMNDLISRVDLIDSSTLKNNVKQYIELYAKITIEKLGETDIGVKNYWLRSTGIVQYSESFKVCGLDYKTGEGATCTWTVPVGATEAKFQVWGAGSGTNPGCMCGGAPFGANGAYSELTLGVVPGNQYVLCAGCSCAISCCSNTAPGYGCMSGVTGPGICCLKADAGSYNNCAAMNSARTTIGMAVSPRYQNLYCNNSGPCWCNYGEYCFTNSCGTCGEIPFHADCCNRTYCACGTDTCEINKGGHRPLHGGGYLGCDNYGYHTRPPILDSDTCEKYRCGCECGQFTSGSCCGGCLGNTWSRHPGMGGAYSHIMGGSYNHYGGIGAGGMVKVSWK